MGFKFLYLFSTPDTAGHFIHAIIGEDRIYLRPYNSWFFFGCTYFWVIKFCVLLLYKKNWKYCNDFGVTTNVAAFGIVEHGSVLVVVIFYTKNKSGAVKTLVSAVAIICVQTFLLLAVMLYLMIYVIQAFNHTDLYDRCSFIFEPHLVSLWRFTVTALFLLLNKTTDLLWCMCALHNDRPLLSTGKYHFIICWYDISIVCKIMTDLSHTPNFHFIIYFYYLTSLIVIVSDHYHVVCQKKKKKILIKS